MIPARAAGRLRIRGDHGDSGPSEVLPVADLLRVARAHDEDDRGRVRRAVSGKAGPPRRGKEAASLRDRVDVAREGERHDVGLEPVDDRPRLLARAAVGLVDRESAVRRLPRLPERGVDLLVELARGVVRDVQQRPSGRHGEEGRRGRRGREEERRDFFEGEEKSECGGGPREGASRPGRGRGTPGCGGVRGGVRGVPCASARRFRNDRRHALLPSKKSSSSLILFIPRT